MTVLIGFTNGAVVVLAADNRITNSQTGSWTDNYKKLFSVHGALTLAIGGNVSLSTIVLDYIKRNSDVDKLNVESAATLIKDFLQNPGQLACLVPRDCAVLVAGIGANRQPALQSITKNDKGVTPLHAPYIVCPPSDLSQAECEELFRCSFETHQSIPFEHTIAEISKISKYVSPTGNIWKYDPSKNQGAFNDF